jgi:hypothetical protein
MCNYLVNSTMLVWLISVTKLDKEALEAISAHLLFHLCLCHLGVLDT